MEEGVVMKKICLLFLFIASTFLWASEEEREAALERTLKEIMAIKPPKIEQMDREQLLGLVRSQRSTMGALIDNYEVEKQTLLRKLEGQRLASGALLAGDAVMRRQLEQQLEMAKGFASGIIQAVEGDGVVGMLPVQILGRLQQALATRDLRRQGGDGSVSGADSQVRRSLEFVQKEEIDSLQRQVAELRSLYENSLKLIKREEVEESGSNRKLRSVVLALKKRDGEVEEVALQAFEALLDDRAITPKGPKTPDPE